MKTCTLCSNRIRPKQKLCYDCFKQFKDYINEPWFKELVQIQQHQDNIDRREYSLSGDSEVNIYGNSSDNTTFKKSVGRPTTDRKLVNEVLRIYDLSLENGKRYSLRRIQKEMNGRVKYLTIRRILQTYRKESYKAET
jgi:hypothetical protein